MALDPEPFGLRALAVIVQHQIGFKFSASVLQRDTTFIHDDSP
jgi:hypothetical protein